MYLVRHATADRSLNIPYALPPGPPLTEWGRAEAQQAADWLAGRGIEHIFASPFERTTQTAAMLVDRLGLDVTFTNALQEGAPGEGLPKVRARVVEALEQLDDSPLRCVALVTHGACVLSVLQHTTKDRIDLSRHKYDNGNYAPTAGIWHGTRRDDIWRWELAFRPSTVETHAVAPREVLL